MGLIKHYQIQEKGEIIIEKKPAPAPQARALQERVVEVPYPEEMAVSKALSEAARIIEEAKAQSNKIKETARQEGLKQGETAGKAESAQKIKEALEVLNSAIAERKKIVKDAEAEILRLSLKAAEQIIRSEVSLHRDVCLNIVSEAINRISDREQVIVRVNREDAEYIKRYKDRLAGILDGVKSFSVLEDSTIEPGGCVIETNLGYVDARISTKLKSIEEALQKVATAEEA
jgi:flagellar assembly protein FliH